MGEGGREGLSPTVKVGDEKWATEHEREKLDANVTVGGQSGWGGFLPTVKVGDEKWTTEHERKKLDANVTVGGQGRRYGGKLEEDVQMRELQGFVVRGEVHES